MSYLEIENLHKNYANNPIFQDIAFYAERGEFVTLLGPSGCGKSTLLRCIAGLTDITGGQIRLNGRDITALSPQKRNITMVFQSYALFPNMTVFDNVAFGLKMRKELPSAIKERVERILTLVELQDYAKRYTQQLSGGQRQRVALARSLVTRPDLLLLDEPLSALDARIRKRLREQIKKIQKEFNLTTIFVTHDQEEALTMSDRIVLMNQGRIEQNCDAETLYLSPKTHFSASFIGNYNVIKAPEASVLLGRSITQDIAIRPEAIGLEPDFINGKGHITERSLLGNIVRYRVSVGGIHLTVDHLNLSKEELLPVGSVVKLDIPSTQIQELECNHSCYSI